MPRTVFQPRLLEKNPAWNSGSSLGVHQAALMVASTSPKTSALAMFPNVVFRHGSFGWMATA